MSCENCKEKFVGPDGPLTINGKPYCKECVINILRPGDEDNKRQIFISTGNYKDEEMKNVKDVKINELFIPNVEGERVLVIVDVQNDFVNGIAGGANLNEPGTDKMIDSCINQIRKSSHIILTKDYHPKDHMSFKNFGEHCLIQSKGAHIAKPIRDAILNRAINKDSKVEIGYKGYVQDQDSYGGAAYHVGEEHYKDRAKELGHTRTYKESERVGGMVCHEDNSIADENFLTNYGYNPSQQKVASLKKYDWRKIIEKNKTIVICGLILDYCVIDTAINLSLLAKEMNISVKIVISLSATRPGRHPCGLFTKFSDIVDKLTKYNIKLEEGV